MLLDEKTKAILFEIDWEDSLEGQAIVSKEGKFLLVNPRFCEITGYNEYELQKRTYQSITHPDDVEADEGMAGRLAEGMGERYRMRKRYITKEGNMANTILSVSIVNIDGEPVFFFSRVLELEAVKAVIKALPSGKTKVSYLKWIKDNWATVTIVVTILGAIIAEVLKDLHQK